MEENNIRKYAKLMRELGLTGLEIKENGSAMRLERLERLEHAAEAAEEKTVPTVATPVSGNVISICSPMVGVFYCAPAENAAPFVQVGDVVHKGDVLCIIEAMKLMNEITAEQDGTIVDVCVGDGQIVDFGRVLFQLEKEQK